MGERPYTVLSCCVSMDGYLDDGGRHRLLLSNDLDFERVDALRASSDAILVGAGTVRSDDPRLLVRSASLRELRVAAGLSPTPVRVTVTASGAIDPASLIFSSADAETLVYCATPATEALRSRIGRANPVVEAGRRPSMRSVSEDLFDRGIRRLMVEGGGDVLTQFLTGGLADELQLAIAPVFVGDSRGRRFVGEGRFPWQHGGRANLVETRAVGDVAVLRYALSDRVLASDRGALATASATTG